MCRYCGHEMHSWLRCVVIRKITCATPDGPVIVEHVCGCTPVVLEGT
jgi:hypothetical protein